MTEQEYRDRIIEMVTHIDDVWLLNQIMLMIGNVTKEEGEDDEE